jgi:hypothetical protein
MYAFMALMNLLEFEVKSDNYIYVYVCTYTYLLRCTNYIKYRKHFPKEAHKYVFDNFIKN